MRPGLILAGWLAVSAFMSMPGWAAHPQDSQGQKVSTAPEKNRDGGDKKDSGEIEKTNDEKTETSTAIKGNWKGLGERFLVDQKQIWTSPARLRWPDTLWLMPLSGVTTGMFVTDADMSRHISHNPTTVSHYNTASNVGVAALLGGAGAMWLFSYPKHNEHWRETGFLAAEAVLNSFVVVEAMKYPLGRERPDQGNGNGNFFSGGTSFPSEHAAASWAVASVVAHEYPGPLTKILAYGLATFVDYSRYRARQHFPSDVFIGSVIGNLVAEDMYNRHHDPELGGAVWNSFRSYLSQTKGLSSADMGSPYVPLDSWIYPALLRLAGMGALDTAFLGMRPWTRSECARLLSEASDYIDAGVGGPEAEHTYRLLQTEFRDELEAAGVEEPIRVRLESVYANMTGISGKPLTDGFHFGQTITNNFGRPFQEGFNTVDGFSGWTTTGHWVAYVRAEYQHAPSAPALPLSARQFIGSSTFLPTPPPTPLAAENSFQLLDAYAGLNVGNWQITFGKQSLWWGPSQGGPLIFANNAAPVNMIRVNRISPFKLPWIFGWLGPWRLEWVFGQLEGHEFVDDNKAGLVGQWGSSLGRQPLINGGRFSFKPFKDFELGFSAAVVFAGGPTPLTWHTFGKSFTPFNVSTSPTAEDITFGNSGLDFTLRVPGLRNWLTFYTEALVRDEFSPIAYWRNSAIWSGLYLNRVPKIPKLDLRVESGYTDLPGDLQTGAPNSHYSRGIFYYNDRFPNGYTNDGNLLANWMGRQSQGTEAWSTYRFNPRNYIQASYRHQKVSQQYMPGGATINDASIGTGYWFREKWNVSATVQYEKWNYPLLAPRPQTNIVSSVGIAFAPFGGRVRKDGE